MKKLILLSLLAFSSTSLVAIYAGGLIVDGETRLIISDSDTERCISILPDADFKWITEPNKLIDLESFILKYNITIRMSERESVFCDSYMKYHVAKNRTYPTRPMRNEFFEKTPHRIGIGNPCESLMIKPYSSTDSSRGYFFATNKDGFRGLTICSKGK